MNRERNNYYKGGILVFSCAYITSVGVSSFLYYQNKTVSKNISSLSEKQAVCYIEGNNNVYFASIEKALEVAANNDTSDNIIVLPSEGIMITSDCYIDALDTLIIPYELTGEGNNKVYKYENLYDGAKDDKIDTKLSLFSKVTIGSNVTLTIENGGKLIVGGQHGVRCSTENSTKNMGMSVGRYAELSFDLNSKIINYGEIINNGFITEYSDSVGMINMESGSILRSWLPIFDFPGGTTLIITILKSVMPFKSYNFPNIWTPIKFKHGSNFFLNAAIGASGINTVKITANILGDNDTNLLRLKSGELIWNFVNDGYTIGKIEDNRGYVALTTYGEIDIGSMILELEGFTSLDTSRYYFPLTNVFDFTINGNTNINNKVKFMPGARVKVGTNGVVNVNANTVAYQADLLHSPIPGYPTGKDSAIIYNDGVINLNAGFGGRILPGNANNVNSKIYVNSGFYVPDDCKELDGRNETEAYIFPASSYIADSLASLPANDVVLYSGKVYEYKMDENYGAYYYLNQSKITTIITQGDTIGAYEDPVFSVEVETDSGWEHYDNPEKIYAEAGAKFKITNLEHADQITVNGLTFSKENFSDLYNKEFVLSSNDSEIIIYKEFLGEHISIESASISVSGNEAVPENGGTVTLMLDLEPSKFAEFMLIDEKSLKWTLTLVDLEGEDNRGDIPNCIEIKPYKIDNKYYADFVFEAAAGKKGQVYYDFKVSGIDLTNDQTFTATKRIEYEGSEGGCFVPGTLIDVDINKKVKIEDLNIGDEVLSFNHFTGEIEKKKIFYIYHTKKRKYAIIKLLFDDGTKIDVVESHAFFNVNKREYDFINSKNYNEFLNDEYLFLNNFGKFVTKKLINITLSYEENECFGIVTENNINHFLNGSLSMVGEFYCLYNFLQIDADYKYNQVSLEKDIEQYGLYTYDDWKDFVSLETFNALNGPFVKIAVLKGRMNRFDIIECILKYLK